MQSRDSYRSFGRNPQEELEKFTVQISRVGEEAALGTGILVTNDGLVATCYHVVKSIIKSRSAGPSNKKYVIVSFSDGAIRLEAEILEQYCKESLDIAILKIDKVPTGYEEAKLGVRIYDYFSHNFVSRGYRKNERYSHLPSNGTISDVVYSKDWSSDVIRLESTNYGETGMSGSAVFDVDLNQGLVVGMMRFHDEDEVGVDDKAPYAILVSDIMKTCPEIQSKNRGLVVYEFLNTIQSHNSESYKDIDYLWIAPQEYDDIDATLERDRVVIITGPPEYGKTYTAIRILWEYYHYKGYLPILFDMEDRRWDRANFQEKIDKILNFAAQNKHVIVYLNDPFGKTEYIEPYIEELTAFVDGLGEFKDSRLIVTSRVWNYANVSDSLSKNMVKSLVRFDISKPSYDDHKREQILLMHAQNNHCIWFKDETVVNFVLSLMKQDMLPTLLNIFSYVRGTRNEITHDKLEEKMEMYSEDTPRAFAKEIKREHYDLMEFLSFPFISGEFETEFVRSQYQELIKDKANKELYDFDEIAEKFKDKISTEKYVNYTHPSFFEALQFVLEPSNSTAQDRQKPNLPISGFRKVIFKLAQLPDNKNRSNKRVAVKVGEIIAKNYRNLPTDIQELLFKLAYDNPITGWDNETTDPYGLTNVIAKEYLHKLPADVANALWRKLADNEKAVTLDIALGIAKNYNKLDPDVQELLFKLADNQFPFKAIYVARAMIGNYNNLPADVANALLRKLADNEKAAFYVARAIIEYYNKLDPDVQELLFKLADNENVYYGWDDLNLEYIRLADLIAKNYNNLPADVANALLRKLADNENEAQWVALAISDYSDNLPADVANALLRKLADNEKAAFYVARAIIEYYNKLDPDVQELLFKLADSNIKLNGVLDVAEEIAETIAKNYNNLPADVANALLRKLADNEKAAFYVTITIIENYRNLPTDIQELLFKLADNENVYSRTIYLSGEGVLGLADLIAKNYNNLPADVANALLGN